MERDGKIRSSKQREFALSIRSIKIMVSSPITSRCLRHLFCKRLLNTAYPFSLLFLPFCRPGALIRGLIYMILELNLRVDMFESSQYWIYLSNFLVLYPAYACAWISLARMFFLQYCIRAYNYNIQNNLKHFTPNQSHRDPTKPIHLEKGLANVFCLHSNSLSLLGFPSPNEE